MKLIVFVEISVNVTLRNDVMLLSTTEVTLVDTKDDTLVVTAYVTL